MIRYERVDLEGGRRLCLRIVGEDAQWLRGIEVDREGEEVQPRGADQRLHVIHKGAIRRRVAMVMDRTYAVLETLTGTPRRRATRREDAPAREGKESSEVLIARIEWSQMSPRVQAHGCCRYCDAPAIWMRRRGRAWTPLCAKHAGKEEV